ncbi:Predicted integral membrane protein [Moraxella caviae]|uniref:Predicted integral membrane protein n=1 Tax=Moraxella caviae TaxID=34060 RepID=A0A378RBM9_9GAMM|nr:Predicted integral membrane protein [Moraxella caviae]
MLSLAALVPPALLAEQQPAYQVLQFIATLVLGLFFMFLMAGVLNAAKRADLTQNMKFSDFFTGFHRDAKPVVKLSVVLAVVYVVFVIFLVVAMSLLAGSAYLVGQMFGLQEFGVGLALLVVAAYLLLMAVSWVLTSAMTVAMALVIFHRYKSFAAIKLALRGCFKNMAAILIYNIVMTFLMYLSMIPLGLGLLVTVPMMLIAQYVIYKQIFTKTVAV